MILVRTQADPAPVIFPARRVKKTGSTSADATDVLKVAAKTLEGGLGTFVENSRLLMAGLPVSVCEHTEFTKLPYDTIVHIMSFLTNKAIATSSKVCRAFWTCAKESQVRWFGASCDHVVALYLQRLEESQKNAGDRLAKFMGMYGQSGRDECPKESLLLCEIPALLESRENCLLMMQTTPGMFTPEEKRLVGEAGMPS